MALNTCVEPWPLWAGGVLVSHAGTRRAGQRGSKGLGEVGEGRDSCKHSFRMVWMASSKMTGDKLHNFSFRYLL